MVTVEYPVIVGVFGWWSGDASDWLVSASHWLVSASDWLVRASDWLVSASDWLVSASDWCFSSWLPPHYWAPLGGAKGLKFTIIANYPSHNMLP